MTQQLQSSRRRKRSIFSVASFSRKGQMKNKEFKDFRHIPKISLIKMKLCVLKKYRLCRKRSDLYETSHIQTLDSRVQSVNGIQSPYGLDANLVVDLLIFLQTFHSYPFRMRSCRHFEVSMCQLPFRSAQICNRSFELTFPLSNTCSLSALWLQSNSYWLTFSG